MDSPEEKANDLVNTFRVILMSEDTDCGNEILCTLIAIKHAEICVNEIITAFNNVIDKYSPYSDVDYWEKVKTEIKKL